MSKEVKIASSRWSEPQVRTTDAITWGDLKAELGTEVLNYEGAAMKAILRSENGERNVLVDNTTLLPQGNFALLLVPEKVKSGSKIVYNTAVFKDMKTKLVKLLDFMIDVTEKGGEIVFDEAGEVAEDIDLEDEPSDEEELAAMIEAAPVKKTVDPLIEEAQRIARGESI